MVYCDSLSKDQQVTTKVYDSIIKAKISHITTFMSWLYHNLEGNKDLYMIDFFEMNNLASYFNFQLKQLGKNIITNSSSIRKMIETFRFVCKHLEYWVSDYEYYHQCLIALSESLDYLL